MIVNDRGDKDFVCSQQSANEKITGELDQCMSDAEWWGTFEAQPLQYPGQDAPFAYQFETVYFVHAPSISRQPISFLRTRAVVEIRSRRPLRTNIVFFDILWDRNTHWATVLYEDTHLAPNRGG